MNLKKLSKYSLFLLLVICLNTTGIAKQKLIESIWTTNKIDIDGIKKDWNNIQFIQKKKFKIEYALKNDENYLYIFFIFNDFKFLSTINTSGMTIWLNNKIKKKKQYGINFKKRMISPEAFIGILEKKYGPLPEDKKKEIKTKKFYTIYQNGIVNKNTDEIIPINIASQQAPSFATQQTQNQITFEFRIPLKKVESKIVGIGTNPGGNVMLGFEWGGMTKEERARRSRIGGRNVGSSSKGGVDSNVPGSQEVEGATTSSMGGPGTRSSAGYRGPKKYSLLVAVTLAEKE